MFILHVLELARSLNDDIVDVLVADLPDLE